MSFKASKYTIWMNYDNDKKQYQVPMNPESIQIKIDGKAVTSDIDRLGLNIWDYSNMPLNLWGQICLPFSCLWFFLSAVAIILDDELRYNIFGEEKPHYYFWRKK